jgi:mannose-6-phosphate isomerase-like protein (cupin superfamily)
MPVVHPDAAPRFDNTPGTEVVGLASPTRGSAQIAAWRLRLAAGASSPPHSLDAEEVFVVLSGRARITYGDQADEVGAGGALIAPIGREFILMNPGSEPFEAVACAPAGIRATVGGETFGPPWAA